MPEPKMQSCFKLKSLTGCFLILLISLILFVNSSYENKIEYSAEKALDEGEARVVIDLKDNSSEIKKEVISQIGEENVKYSSEDLISAIVSEEDIEDLNLNNIESIKLVNSRKIFLQDSINLINASTTFKIQSSGINLTGKGETICIIDTGVNYTHSSLGGCYGDNNVSSSCKIIGGWDFCADNSNCLTQDSEPLDVHGHGTHVAGIVSASGGITGVAPDSKIIMIKASNSRGSFWDDDLKAAIDWCVGNSTKFNISVISMSLGGGLYSEYCDNKDDAIGITSSINNAIANNISVVVATGNSGSSTKISFPACIQNSTAVGAIKKDGLTIVYNRNNITDFLAPGYSINSTYSSGYASLSGTSMATPHVAGTLALISQYFKSLYNRQPTPSEVQAFLETNSPKIFDSANNLSFSRIDVYSTILAINSSYIKDSNKIKLEYPLNNTFTNKNETFNCSVKSLSNLSSISFYIWLENSTYNLTQEITGIENSSIFYFNFTDEGEYIWTCSAINIGGEIYSSNYSLNYDATSPEINLVSPENSSEYNSNSQEIIFEFNSSESNVSCGLNINNAIVWTNDSINLINQKIYKTFSPGGYNWSIECNDTASNIGVSVERNFKINEVVIASSGGGSGGGGGGGGGSVSPSALKIINQTIIAVNETKENITRIIEIQEDTPKEQTNTITGMVIGESVEKNAPLIAFVFVSLTIVGFVLIQRKL